jgi:hypothetical protein
LIDQLDEQTAIEHQGRPGIAGQASSAGINEANGVPYRDSNGNANAAVFLQDGVISGESQSKNR